MADQPDDRGRQGERQTLSQGAPAAEDVIAAVATPPGRGGIGIVRVSGAMLGPMARQLAGFEPEPRRATRAGFRDSAGTVIDEGLVLYFPSPHSYTGEDVLELHGHGGPVIQRLVLARCLELGARIAEPGEFTRRAFLNDKLDLAQAEAVADVIDAATETAARCALRSLRGEFSRRVDTLLQELVELRILVEATLDFPEEQVETLDRDEVRVRLAHVRLAIARALEQGRQGSVLRSGLTVVLVGRPNVGKSSLLNHLAGEDVAIVTPVPGTTRDAVRQTVQIEGIPLHVVDTAGLRDTRDPVEVIGIERTWAAIEGADLVMLIADARTGLESEDHAILARLPARLPRILVLNKTDLVTGPSCVERPSPFHTVRCSALTGEGLAALRTALLQVAGWQPGGEDIFMARERHLLALAKTAASLQRAEGQLDATELLAEELRMAQCALSVITGEYGANELLGEIFARFCIGK